MPYNTDIKFQKTFFSKHSCMAKNVRVVTGFRIKYQINCQFLLLLFLPTSFSITKEYIKPEKANLSYHQIFDILK